MAGHDSGVQVHAPGSAQHVTLRCSARHALDSFVHEALDTGAERVALLGLDGRGHVAGIAEIAPHSTGSDHVTFTEAARESARADLLTAGLVAGGYLHTHARTRGVPSPVDREQIAYPDVHLIAGRHHGGVELRAWGRTRRGGVVVELPLVTSPDLQDRWEAHTRVAIT